MGENLFDEIIKGTGLPKELVSQELLKKILDKGYEKESITLEQIRDVLSEFLQEVLLKAREEFR